jgi:hypothetical protein
MFHKIFAISQKLRSRQLAVLVVIAPLSMFSTQPIETIAAAPEFDSQIAQAEVNEANEATETTEVTEAIVFTTPPQQPTTVKIGMYLIGITAISEPSEMFPTFTASMFMDLQWQDQRLAFDASEVGTNRKVLVEQEAQLELERIWHPDIIVENQETSRETEDIELIIYADGTVEYEERFSAIVNAEFDLIKFPFDAQKLTVDFQSLAWDNRFVVLVPYEDRIGYDEDFSNPEWQFTGISFELEEEAKVRNIAPYSEFTFVLHAQRVPGFYIWKILTPFMVIVLLSWTVFWMGGEAITGRMTRSFICVLSMVALQRVIASYLPRIAAITFLDSLVFLAYIFIFLTIVENVIYHRIKQSEDKQANLLAHKPDKTEAELEEELLADEDDKHFTEQETETPEEEPLHLSTKVDLIARWLIPGSFTSTLILLILIYL